MNQKCTRCDKSQPQYTINLKEIISTSCFHEDDIDNLERLIAKTEDGSYLLTKPIKIKDNHCITHMFTLIHKIFDEVFTIPYIPITEQFCWYTAHTHKIKNFDDMSEHPELFDPFSAGCFLRCAYLPPPKPLKRKQPLSLQLLAMAEISQTTYIKDIDTLKLPIRLKNQIAYYSTHLDTKDKSFIFYCDQGIQH